MSADLPIATTGIAALDDALAGLLWGDNVIFELDNGVDAAPFYAAIAGTDPWSGRIAVTFSEAFAPSGFELIDGRTADPVALSDAVLTAARAAGSHGLVLVDDLGETLDRWDADDAYRFFARTCPPLLRIGAVAYWTLGGATVGSMLRDRVAGLTQCVLSLGSERLVVIKAEGRPPKVVGTALRYDADDRAGLTVEDAPSAVQLAAGLSALRAQRGMTQSELARIVGVTPSAISQAERGQRGLSLQTLVELCDRLGVSLDGLVRGRTDSGYDLRRRRYPHLGDASREALLDAPGAPLRLHEFRLDPGARGTPPPGARETELVLVGTGLVRVEMSSGAGPVLRDGEAVVATTHAIASWENLGEDEALGFWVALP